MYDGYKYLTSKKLHMNSKVWCRLCYFRQLRIKNYKLSKICDKHD